MGGKPRNLLYRVVNRRVSDSKGQTGKAYEHPSFSVSFVSDTYVFIEKSFDLDDLPKRREDFGIDLEDKAETVRDEMNYLMEKQGKAAVEILVGEKLKSLGLNYSEIEVITDIAEDSRIIIKDIVIKAELTEPQKQQAAEEIEKLTGIRPKFE